MDWINLHTSFLDSPAFLGSEPVDRATWLCLLRYCVGQENSGRIVGARDWGDRKWQQLIGVMLKEVNRPSDLWAWDDDDLVVVAYPLDAEQTVISNRKIGKLGGRPRKPNDNPPVIPPVISDETPRFDFAETKGEGKGKGKERVKKGEGEQASGAMEHRPGARSNVTTPEGNLNSSNPPCPAPAPALGMPAKAPRKPIAAINPDAWWMALPDGERSWLESALHISPDGGDSWRRDIAAIQSLVADFGLNQVVHTARKLVVHGKPPFASKVLEALRGAA